MAEEKLDKILKQLDELKGLPERIEKVTSSVDSFRDEVKVWRQGIEQSLEYLQKDVADLKKDFDVLKKKEVPTVDDFKTIRDDMHNERLKDQIKSYKYNLIFVGLEGHEQNKWDTESNLRQFWVDCLNISEDTAYSILIADCHRLQPRKGQPANIVCKFVQMSDRDYVFSQAKNLKRHKIKTRLGER